MDSWHDAKAQQNICIMVTKTPHVYNSPEFWLQVTVSRIQGTNLDMRVHTPGKLASAQPIPQLMIPARK